MCDLEPSSSSFHPGEWATSHPHSHVHPIYPHGHGLSRGATLEGQSRGIALRPTGASTEVDWPLTTRPIQRVQRGLYLRLVTGRRRFFHAHRPTSITTAASSKAIELGSGTD